MIETFEMSLPSAFGVFTICWQNTEDGPRVLRVSLPNASASMKDAALRVPPEAVSSSAHLIKQLGERMQDFLAGEAVSFQLDLLALDRCSAFQKRVLLAEHGIPRGRVSTYGRIAQHLGSPNAARAVGSALARNPFPLIIPCHRAVRASGDVGGFQGGPGMKRTLLKLEGVSITNEGKVVLDRVFY